MRKLLGILGSLGLVGTAGATAVACANKDTVPQPEKLDFTKLDEAIAKAESRLSTDNPEKPETAYDELDKVVKSAKVSRNEAQSQTVIDNTTVEVETAIRIFDNVAIRADKTELEKEINHAQDLLINSKKSTVTNKTLVKALKLAEDVFEETYATQAKVNIYTNILKMGIKVFESKPNLGNKTDLIAKINEAENLLKNSRKSAAVNDELKNAIAKAQETVDKTEVYQEEIDRAFSALEAAIEIFNQAPSLGNKAELIAKIEQADGLIKNSNKSKEVNESLRTAVIKAQLIVDRTEVYQDEIDQATSELQTAIDIFKEAPDFVDKTELKETIAAAEKSLELNNKLTKAKDNLRSEIELAKKIVNNEQASKSEVAQGVTQLRNAIENFEASPNKGNIFILWNEIIHAETELIEGVNKPAPARRELSAAIAKAKQIMHDFWKGKELTEEEMNQAATELRDVRDRFAKTKIIYKFKLDAEIQNAKKLLENSNKSESVTNNLKSVLKEAEVVYEDEDATQETVNAMTEKLNQAIKVFEAEPDLGDKTELIAKINEAENLLKNSRKSAAVNDELKNAIAKAQETVDKTEVYQEEIDQATAELQTAIDIFKEAPDLEIVDKSKLKHTISFASLIVQYSTKTEAAIAALKAETQIAREVVANQQATQEEVNQAVINLEAAIEVFKASPDVPNKKNIE